MGIDWSIIQKLLRVVAAVEDMRDVIEGIVDEDEKLRVRAAWQELRAAIKALT